MGPSQKVNFKQLPPLTPPYTGGAGGGSWQIQAGLFGQPRQKSIFKLPPPSGYFPSGRGRKRMTTNRIYLTTLQEEDFSNLHVFFRLTISL